MKKNILHIILMVLVFASSAISAQVTQRIMPGDEFLEDDPIVIGDLQPKAECTEFNCAGYENISFRKYDIEHTLRMENLIHSIQSKGISDWLFIQEKIVKTELDRITFTNTTSKYGDYYKAARDIYFERLERGITTNNVNYYNRSYGSSINSKKVMGTAIMKDVKGLTLRHQEIKNGNIYNSKYSLYKYNGQPLSNYKSLSDVANLLKNELSNYYSNDVAMNDNQRIKNRLNQMIKDMSPSSVSSDIMLNKKNFFVDLLRSKESHFKSFSTWNELNLIQKYINNVYKGSNSGTVWPKDFGTKTYVLNHAKANKLGDLTVFHPDYWKVILKNKYNNSWLYEGKAKADHLKLKEAEINRLMTLTPINNNLAVDYIVEDINITNQNQLTWLNSISEEEANQIKGILQMAKASWGSDLDLGSIYRQKKEIEIERIKNAGLVVQMVKDLGITNTTQKSWLYNNIPEATEIRLFVDTNKTNGIVSAEAKNFVGQAIKLDIILDGNLEVKTTGKYPDEISDCCPGDCCPDPNIYNNDPIIQEYGIKPVQAAVDATFNALAIISGVVGSKEWVGKRARRIMKELGIAVPNDISNEQLAELFQIRKKDGLIIVEYREGILKSMLSLGLDSLDILSFISPSKGGGAFLAVKGGDIIAKTKLTEYLRVLAKGQWKTVSESMSDAAKSYQELISGRKWNESFVLNSVKFDGLRNGVLSDAKSGMLNFVNSDGTFKSFFTGKDAIVSQARRQSAAAGDLPIEWHFEHDNVRLAFEKLLKPLGLNIKFIHTPR